MITNGIYETQNLLSLQLVSFLVGLRTYQHPCTLRHSNRNFFKPDVIIYVYFLISNFRRVVNDILFLLDDSPEPEFYVPTFRNTLFLFFLLTRPMKMDQCVPKRLHTKFRSRGITQRKEYIITFTFQNCPQICIVFHYFKTIVTNVYLLLVYRKLYAITYSPHGAESFLKI